MRGRFTCPGKVLKGGCPSRSLSEEQPFKTPTTQPPDPLRQKDPKVTAKRYLDIFVFNVAADRGEELLGHKESLDYLKEQGFHVIPSYLLCSEIEPAVREIEAIGQRRGVPFDIDGLL